MATQRSRRRYLQLFGAAAALGLAGCSDSSDDSDGNTDDGTDGGDNDTDDGTGDESDDGTGDESGDDTGDGSGDGTGDDSDDGTGDDSDDGGQTDAPRLRDVFTWTSSYVMEIDSADVSGTWRFNDGDWLLTTTSDGQTSETYSIRTDSGRDTYVVADGQCFKTSTQNPGEDVFDPEQPAEDDQEYVATGRTTIDGKEVYEFDIDDGVYYVSVNTGYPVRFESPDGTEVVRFHSWGETSPITPPDMDCTET